MVNVRPRKMSDDKRMVALKNSINVEKLVLSKPDYVMKAISEWFANIPREEFDKPVIGDFCAGNVDRLYTPRRLYNEMIGTLRIGLPFKQRKKVVPKMADVTRNLLTEILIEYRENKNLAK